jgi:hypothetical protein
VLMMRGEERNNNSDRANLIYLTIGCRLAGAMTKTAALACYRSSVGQWKCTSLTAPPKAIRWAFHYGDYER